MVTLHDGSTTTTTYNAASDIIGSVDANGSAFAYTQDVTGRLVSVAVTKAANVEGTTAQSFEYDGLSRRTFTRDSIDATHADATFAFDSVGRAVEEVQTYGGNRRYVTQNAFVSVPPTRFTYADAREVGYDYDEMYRRTKIEDDPDGISPSDIAEWSFFGPGRIAELTLGNELICTYMNNARTNSAVQSPTPQRPPWGDQSSDRLGYDGSGRAITKRYLTGGLDVNGAYADTSAVAGFTTRFDHASNKDYERHLHAESRSHLYPTRDSLDRLREYQRGTLQEVAGVVTVASAITLPGTDSQRTYTLDGLGNWKNTIYTPVGGSETTQLRSHNYVNQTTKLGATAVTYDHGDNTAAAAQGNGNIADDGTREHAYDAFNRVVTVTRKSDSALIATYTYDALGRRIRKVVTNGGIPADAGLNGTTDYIYTGVQCIEERNGGNVPQRQYVWGGYIDELVQVKQLTGASAGEYYLMSDLLYRSVALTGAAGAVQEAYDTDAYGNTLCFSGPGTAGNWWASNATTTTDPKCTFIFSGRRYDPETKIYFYRFRYYHAALGRFISRDPVNFGNGPNVYALRRITSVAGLDPLGLISMSSPRSPHIRHKWQRIVFCFAGCADFYYYLLGCKCTEYKTTGITGEAAIKLGLRDCMNKCAVKPTSTQWFPVSAEDCDRSRGTGPRKIAVKEQLRTEAKVELETMHAIWRSFKTWLFLKAMAKIPHSGSLGAGATIMVSVVKGLTAGGQGFRAIMKAWAQSYIEEHGWPKFLRVDPGFMTAFIITMRGKGWIEYAGDILRAVGHGMIDVDKLAFSQKTERLPEEED